MNIRQIILSGALLLISLADAYSQPSNSKLDRFLVKKMDKSDRIGMQAAYIKNGKLSWFGSYGIKTFGTDDFVNDSTLFMVASISKPVTALAMMKLFDQGKVNLDININTYLPFNIKNPHLPEDTITIRMLLCHVSSIRDNWEQLEKGYTIDAGGDAEMSLEEFLKNYLLEGGNYYDKNKNFYDSPSCSGQHYSNVGYSLIGYLVEQISGKAFNEFMKEEVFIPLKMLNTYWFLSEIPHDNMATPHNMPYKETEFKGTQILNHFCYPGYPSGQLRTTVSDYARFMEVLINTGKVEGHLFVKPSTIEEFLKIQNPEISKWQAISWNYNEFQNSIYYLLMPHYPSHTGLDPGMATVVSFDPKSKTGVLIFTNSPTTTFWCEKILYLDMVKRLFKEAKK